MVGQQGSLGETPAVLPIESIFKLSEGHTLHPFGNRPEVADMNVEDIAIVSGKMANREHRQTMGCSQPSPPSTGSSVYFITKLANCQLHGVRLCSRVGEELRSSSPCFQD